eukprot:gnl/TRDRNA2_/TRDRNA2_173015_c4_seq5.p2 gnl/TRDRNA2_/TRDRNA2_173015_c4~~gnl/TRDRNA2_/TRDRNA2_173015_c4_seq5.p2  ORF type:complete len:150 (+),score=32.79 gnl/TRDRNA2_/TRDRNA2_173015_c4_seq5:46-495(+)
MITLCKPSSIPAEFPMYGVKIDDVLKMATMEMHEAIKDKGLLVEIGLTKFTGCVVFVSHTWLSFTGPDPNAEHLRWLQTILRRLHAGKQDIEDNWVIRVILGDKRYSAAELKSRLSDAVVWFDVWGVPQGTHIPGVGALQQQAINSIPA